MVKVTGYATRETADGKRKFITLELSGGLAMIQSQSTGKFYATTTKCSIPTTFDENVAKSLIGSEMPGDIVKQEVEPYEFVNKTTGETLMLNYSYAYQLNPQATPVGSSKELEIA
jgi:hypothetical protein